VMKKVVQSEWLLALNRVVMPVATQHRALLAALGGAGEALWIPETTLTTAELNARTIWGAVATPGDEALTTRANFVGSTRGFRIVERT